MQGKLQARDTAGGTWVDSHFPAGLDSVSGFLATHQGAEKWVMHPTSNLPLMLAANRAGGKCSISRFKIRRLQHAAQGDSSRQKCMHG